MLTVKTVAPYELECINSDIPEISENEVLIKMVKVGICASDVQVYHGKHKYVSFPLVQGHEGVGIVEKVGKQVIHVKHGDLAVVQPHLSCGECYACRKGRHNVCESLRGMGIRADGMFTEYLAAPSWNIIKLPESITSDMGMLVEPIAVGVNAVRQGALKRGDRAVVLGAGTIGNFTAQVAKAIGAEVLITDIEDEKLKLAARHGIKHCVNTRKKDLRNEISRCFDGNRADVIFDCVTVKESFAQALECAASASTIVIVGNFKEPITIEMPLLQRREIALISVMGNVRENWLEAIDLLLQNKIDISEIITIRFPLIDLKKAFEYIDSEAGKTMKVAIEMQ